MSNDDMHSHPLPQPASAKSRKELLTACIIEGKDKRGMTTHVDEGAILDLVKAKSLTRASSEFLRKLCFKLTIRNYWCGSTEDMEHQTRSSSDERKKAIKRLKDHHVVRIHRKANKQSGLWLIEVCPIVAWRGFGNAPSENPIRQDLTYKWFQKAITVNTNVRVPPWAPQKRSKSLNHRPRRDAHEFPYVLGERRPRNHSLETLLAS